MATFLFFVNKQQTTEDFMNKSIALLSGAIVSSMMMQANAVLPTTQTTADAEPVFATMTPEELSAATAQKAEAVQAQQLTQSTEQLVAVEAEQAVTATQSVEQPETQVVASTNTAAQNTLSATSQSTTQNISRVTVASLVTTDATTGQETLTPVTSANALTSGSLVDYTTVFTNNSADRVKAMTVTMGIPKGTVLVGNTVPDYPQATVDGVNYSIVPLQTTVNGQLTAIPLSNYKALRWDLSNMGAGQTQSVSYRVKIK